MLRGLGSGTRRCARGRLADQRVRVEQQAHPGAEAAQHGNAAEEIAPAQVLVRLLEREPLGLIRIPQIPHCAGRLARQTADLCRFR